MFPLSCVVFKRIWILAAPQFWPRFNWDTM